MCGVLHASHAAVVLLSRVLFPVQAQGGLSQRPLQQWSSPLLGSPRHLSTSPLPHQHPAGHLACSRCLVVQTDASHTSETADHQVSACKWYSACLHEALHKMVRAQTIPVAASRSRRTRHGHAPWPAGGSPVTTQNRRRSSTAVRASAERVRAVLLPLTLRFCLQQPQTNGPPAAQLPNGGPARPSPQEGNSQAPVRPRPPPSYANAAGGGMCTALSE